MEKNMYNNDDVRKYLEHHKIPEIIEALLTASAHYKPENPLLHISQNLKQAKDFTNDDITWDIFIDEKDLPVQKYFKPCFVEQHIFDNPFLQEKRFKNMTTAIEHHSQHLCRKYFDALREYQQNQVNKKILKMQNIARADNHFNMKSQKKAIMQWIAHSKSYSCNISSAIKVLQKVLSYSYLYKSFMKWRLFTKDIHWKNTWFQNQAIKQSAAASLCQSENCNKNVDFISRLPKSIAVIIFRYLNLKSRITCSMVCNSWHALLQECALYTELNLTDCGFEMHDLLFNNIVRRYKFFLYHIKLQKCSKLSPKCLLHLRECKNLQDIDLSRCEVTAHLIQEIGIGCPFVQYLNFSGSTINDSCLGNLAKHYPSLKYLDLSNCSTLSEEGFYYFNTNKSLKNLAHINLTGCKKVNGNCLSYIGKCCMHLTSLVLDYIVSLTDECIAKMTATCHRLRVLSLLQAIKITDKSLKYIAIGLLELQKIYIEGNKLITDGGISSIMCLRNLRHIHIVDCLRAYDLGLKPCLSLRLLTVLNLTDCLRITDSGMKYILDSPSAKNISELTLTNCIRIGDQTIQRIVTHCLKLTCLSIAYCENISDVGMSMLSRHSFLYMLDISGCSISDYGLGCLRQIHRLAYLTIAECNLITDLGIEKLSKLENLKYLDMSYCINVSDYGMKMLIYEKKCLTTLNIAGCKLITNSTLSNIASVCLYLQHLNLSEIKGITDKGIRFIRMGCKMLQYLNVSYCPKLNYGCITKFFQLGCEVIHTMNVS